jgi:hypothetical protein
LSYISLFNNDGVPIIARVNVPKLVAEIVDLASLCAVDVGKIIKVETLADNVSLLNPGLPIRNEFFQYFSVFFQDTVHQPHILDFDHLGAVVVTGAALV